MNIRRTAGGLTLALFALLSVAAAQTVCTVATSLSQLSCTTSDLLSAPSGISPNISPECSVVVAGSTQALIGVDGSSWGVNSGGLVTVAGVADTNTAAVTRIVLHNYKIYQQNSALLWWSKSIPSDIWTSTSSPLLADQQPAPTGGAGIFTLNSVTITALQGENGFSTGPSCSGNGCANIDWIQSQNGANAVVIATLTDGSSGSTFTDVLADSTVYANVLTGAKYTISKGMDVVLKPFLMCSNGVLGNCGFKPGDPTNFYNSIETMLLDNAQLSLDAGVTSGHSVTWLIMGTEMGDYVTGPGQLGSFDTCGRWKTIMQHVHARAPNLKLVMGPTMGSYWDYHESNELAFMCPEFFDVGGVQAIGGDPYPHFADTSGCSNGGICVSWTGGPFTAAQYVTRYSNMGVAMSQLQSQGPSGLSKNDFQTATGLQFYSNKANLDWFVSAINARRQTRNPGAANLQFIATEIGAASDADTIEYWGGYGNGGQDQVDQASGIDGVFTALNGDANIYGWAYYTLVTTKNPTDHSSNWNLDFGTNGKAADAIMKKWYTLTH